MIKLKIILLLILLCVSIYLTYKLYSYNSYILNKSANTIIENIDDQFEEINEKLEMIEDLINKKLENCNNKINELYSNQHKVNEIAKMNNQTIINQINQYDEENNEDNDEENKNNVVYNSIETSITPENNVKNKNDNCFVKLNDVENKDKDMFYMSSFKKEKLSKTSDLQSSNSKSSKSNSSSKSSSKSSSENSSNNSTVLEINGDFIKSFNIHKLSPKYVDAIKILNTNTNIIKNNSNNKLHDLEKYTNDNNVETTSSDNIILMNDPPLLLADLLKKSYNINVNKIIELE